MEQENYQMNIETLANSLMELEEYGIESKNQPDPPASNSVLPIALPTYYRSKAFSSNISINNLINASDPILTLVTKLRQIPAPPDANVLYLNLCHEIKAFENKAQTQGYRLQIIFAAKFVVCALLDELIAITLWPNLEWKKYSLIETFHKENWEHDQFYLILERGLQDAVAHIDLLELIYICLRLGYEGKFRSIERGHLELKSMIDHLYHVITQHREEFSRSLLIRLGDPSHQLSRQKNYFHLLPSAWLISTIMIVSLIIIFIFFYSKLIETASPIYQFINTFHSQEGESTNEGL